MASMSFDALKGKLRETRKSLRGLWLKLWGGGCLLVILGFAAAWFFVKPAPPKTIVIAAGPKDGSYYRFARSYADSLAESGIRLELRETAGSLENYHLLHTDPEVHLAIVQGGTAPQDVKQAGDIEALASLYLEPVWVFYRSDRPFDDLRDLRGKRIAVGRADSGTQVLADALLKENGVDASSGAKLLSIGGKDAVRQLRDKRIDALVFVTSPRSPLVRELIRDSDIRLLDFRRHAGYQRRHPFLKSVVLRRGVIDMLRDLPKQDVHLIAPVANLVAGEEFHEALVPLVLAAVEKAHRGGNELVAPEQFPSTEFAEFPVNDSARRYFVSGPPFLQRYLPFWVASAIDRGKVLLIPAITLLFPLFKLAPLIYRWRTRSKIYRWYRILRAIETDLKDGSREDLPEHTRTLSAMQQELDEIASVPLSFMEEFYNLRLHVEFVQRRVTKALEAGDDEKVPEKHTTRSHLPGGTANRRTQRP